MMEKIGSVIKKNIPGSHKTAVNTILCVVEEGRQQFHREMASIMPDVKLGEKNSRLTEDELNMFITHAYRKVSQAFAFRGLLLLHFFFLPVMLH
jgi:hypothetical protein